jgi:hypothetical protein
MLDRDWRKSTRSGGNGQCVEARRDTDGAVQVRDSKDPAGPVLTFTADGWTAFLDGARRGEFSP